MTRLAVTLTAVCASSISPTMAQDELSTYGHLATSTELAAKLAADETVGLAFIAGVMGGLHLRATQGDPVLWWVPRCVAATYLAPSDLVPGLRTWVQDNVADASGHSGLASNAILHVFAEHCAAAMSTDEIALPE